MVGGEYRNEHENGNCKSYQLRVESFGLRVGCREGRNGGKRLLNAMFMGLL